MEEQTDVGTVAFQTEEVSARRPDNDADPTGHGEDRYERSASQTRGRPTSTGAAEDGSSGRMAEPMIPCIFCGEGMARGVVPRFSRGYGMMLLVVGLLLSMFMSMLLGLPMVMIGAYMSAANRAVWMCRACGAVVDRTGT